MTTLKDHRALINGIAESIKKGDFAIIQLTSLGDTAFQDAEMCSSSKEEM